MFVTMGSFSSKQSSLVLSGALKKASGPECLRPALTHDLHKLCFIEKAAPQCTRDGLVFSTAYFDIFPGTEVQHIYHSPSISCKLEVQRHVYI